MPKLNPHPRLLIDNRCLERLRHPDRHPLVQTAAAQVIALADEYRQGTSIDLDGTQHNAHLIRARAYQCRILTLLVRWRWTDDERYRRAAMAHVRAMQRWRYWSWILWRRNDARPDGIFDLSYGENSATLALAWDLLQPTLSAAEKQIFIDMARTWPVAAFYANDANGRNWWFGKPDSNWNTVCAGGLGMLALAMMEALPEAQDLIKRVNQSFKPYIHQLDRYGGGWPEGIGYWGYGMRYAFMYLLSSEAALGKPHPLMKRPGVTGTLAFPIDFAPHGAPCSFGDVNSFKVMPFQYLLAERFNRPDLTALLDHSQTSQPTPHKPRPTPGAWPQAAETLLFHPGRRRHAIQRRTMQTRHYPRLDWYTLSDRWPDSRMYLSIRGGTTEVPHGHTDLTSFHLVVDDEAMIVNLTPSEYLDTTFSPRRWELFEMSPPSKNVLLINGVGISRPATVRSRALRCHGYPAVRLDAGQAMGLGRDHENPVRFYARLFVLLSARAVLVVDRVILRQFGRFDMRFHTRANVTADNAEAFLRGERRSLRALFAADVPAHAERATDALTSPGPTSSLLRWRSDRLHARTVMACLLVAGTPRKDDALTVNTTPDGIQINARAAGRRYRLPLSDRLIPAK